MVSAQHPTSAKTRDEAPVVYVVDDDESMRLALSNLLRSVGLNVETFGSVRDFLSFSKAAVPSCLILDVRLRGESGLAFQQEMVRSGLRIPVLFMTGHGDIEMSVKAMRAGALNFFPKPFRDQDMLDAVTVAIERDRKRRETDRIVANLQSYFDTLTPREREILTLISSGLMNKQIAAELGLAEITVKIHRGHIMKKMGAKSLADLLRKAETLGIRRAKP